MIAGLAVKSLRNRGFTAGLTVLSVALAVLLLLGVERIRHESRESFAATVSGTDLLVGARSSPVHLLLSAVFHIGNPTNNLRWETYKAIAARPEIAWTIPLSLGDSHKGYRVLGTTPDYFEHLRYGRGRRLQMAQGHAPEGERDAVVGADVAETLRYRTGDSIVVAHGAGDVSFSLHEQHPFTVSGVLARTGTPVDRTVHVSLQGLDVMHEDADAGSAGDPLFAALQEGHADPGHEPRAITAFLVGLKSRSAALGVQRAINEYDREPLTAVMPGVALQEVWEITGAAERTLFAVSALVVVVGLAGMLVALLTSLGERRREMAVLRSVGARPSQIFGLILGEAAFLTLMGIALGVVGLYAGLFAGQTWLESRLGLFIVVGWPSAYEAVLMALVALAGILIGLVPAWRIYRYSLADGMSIRI
ncbi:MAG TPA: ABC transporter permease [Burkholderiales bacterium]